jgi:hypothetical protein
VFLDEFVDEFDERGFAGADIIDLFYILERQGRWGSTVIRPSDPIAFILRPFVCREHLEVALQMSPRDRYGQRFQALVIEATFPELTKVPFMSFTKNTTVGRYIKDSASYFGAAHVLKRLRRRKSMKAAEAMWVSRHRDEIRSVCLDHADSSLWEFVNREQVERHLRLPDGSPEFAVGAAMLLRVATLFCYQELCIG